MARIIELWEFHCPDCGFGHHELGRLARDEEFFCLVCESDYGRLVKLRRWLAEDEPAGQARLRAT